MVGIISGVYRDDAQDKKQILLGAQMRHGPPRKKSKKKKKREERETPPAHSKNSTCRHTQVFLHPWDMDFLLGE